MAETASVPVLPSKLFTGTCTVECILFQLLLLLCVVAAIAPEPAATNAEQKSICTASQQKEIKASSIQTSHGRVHLSETIPILWILRLYSCAEVAVWSRYLQLDLQWPCACFDLPSWNKCTMYRLQVTLKQGKVRKTFKLPMKTDP